MRKLTLTAMLLLTSRLFAFAAGLPQAITDFHVAQRNVGFRSILESAQFWEQGQAEHEWHCRSGFERGVPSRVPEARAR
ncbi:MAG: hypothetical protein JST28_08950 [Acidobacteria bacterium]|nr:hypothetical protein [Acidobacteriota bacterium]